MNEERLARKMRHHDADELPSKRSRERMERTAAMSETTDQRDDLKEAEARLSEVKKELEQAEARVRQYQATLKETMEQKEALEAKPSEQPPHYSTFLDGLLKDVKFPSLAEVMGVLQPYQTNNIHGEAEIPAHLHPNLRCPALALDVFLPRLTDDMSRHGTTSDTLPCGVALLGPSGSGKTRKILQCLKKNVGYFLPYKEGGSDEKFGSKALCEMLNLVKSHRDWSDAAHRRTLVEFGMRCLLMTYQAVYDKWMKSIKLVLEPDESIATAWLLAQLFPLQCFEQDIFLTITGALFTRYSSYKTLLYDAILHPRQCFIDEAQSIVKLGPVLSSIDDSPRSLRTLLSAVLSGVRLALGVDAIIAGTGFSLVREYRTMHSQMAAIDGRWAYVDFPLLPFDDVKQMLSKRLNVKSQKRLDEAAHWLVGRPRFAATFIEKLLTSGGTVDDFLDEYVRDMCSPPRTEIQVDVPRTPAEAFAKLRTSALTTPLITHTHFRSSPPSPLPDNRTFDETYFIGLQDAFRRTIGLPPQILDNVILFDVDIAYIVNVVAADRDPNVEIKMEPLVLEAATRHVVHYQPQYL